MIFFFILSINEDPNVLHNFSISLLAHAKLRYNTKASGKTHHFPIFLSVEHVTSKHVVPPIGSSIPTLVSRVVDPLNGAASKRPHSPSSEEQAKRLKETEKARIHIA